MCVVSLDGGSYLCLKVTSAARDALQLFTRFSVPGSESRLCVVLDAYALKAVGRRSGVKSGFVCARVCACVCPYQAVLTPVSQDHSTTVIFSDIVLWS